MGVVAQPSARRSSCVADCGVASDDSNGTRTNRNGACSVTVVPLPSFRYRRSVTVAQCSRAPASAGVPLVLVQ